MGYNRPYRLRHLPRNSEQYTFTFVSAFLWGISASIIGTLIGVGMALAPIFQLSH